MGRPSRTAQVRTGWYAGTRSEVLLLGPLFREFRTAKGGLDFHRFVTTGEQGVQAVHALDALGLLPDEAMELLPPDDDPGIRLWRLIQAIERDVRRNRVGQIVCSGFGPAAAACALVAHSRRARLLWLKPDDPSGLIPRQDWENGLVSVVSTLGCTTILACPRHPIDSVIPVPARPDISGTRSGCPLVLVSVGRAHWGINGTLARLVTGLGDWARARPDLDILVLLSMDMRLHGALGSLRERPSNLLSTAPLPPSDYAALLGSARLLLTDSPHAAAEGLARGLRVLTLGESTSDSGATPEELVATLTPDQLSGDHLSRVAGESPNQIQQLTRNPPPPNPPTDLDPVRRWIRGETL